MVFSSPKASGILTLISLCSVSRHLILTVCRNCYNGGIRPLLVFFLNIFVSRGTRSCFCSARRYRRLSSKHTGKLFSRVTVNSIETVCSCSRISTFSDSIIRTESKSVEKNELIMSHHFAPLPGRV